MGAFLGTVTSKVDGVFSQDLCKNLVEQFNKSKEVQLGRIIMPNNDYVLNTRYKYRYDWFLPDGELKQQLKAKVQEACCKSAEREFGCPEQEVSDTMLVVKYPLGGTYGPHVDAPYGREDVLRFSVALRLPGEWEGGKLIFPNDNVEIPSIGIGDAVVCDTRRKHAITHVTKGERYIFLAILHDKVK